MNYFTNAFFDNFLEESCKEFLKEFLPDFRGISTFHDILGGFDGGLEEFRNFHKSFKAGSSCFKVFQWV